MVFGWVPYVHCVELKDTLAEEKGGEVNVCSIYYVNDEFTFT